MPTVNFIQPHMDMRHYDRGLCSSRLLSRGQTGSKSGAVKFAIKRHLNTTKMTLSALLTRTKHITKTALHLQW